MLIFPTFLNYSSNIERDWRARSRRSGGGFVSWFARGGAAGLPPHSLPGGHPYGVPSASMPVPWWVMVGGFSKKRFLSARCAIVVLSLYVFFRSRSINWSSQGQKWLQRGFFYSEIEIYQSFIKGKISQRDFIPNWTIAL